MGHERYCSVCGALEKECVCDLVEYVDGWQYCPRFEFAFESLTERGSTQFWTIHSDEFEKDI